jgi:pimeloyl-ACP methyl ester carboxylesterase
LNFGQTKDPVLKAYRKALIEGLAAARRAGVPPADLVAASVFTTQSTTAVLEKIRAQLKAKSPEPADFKLAEDGSRTVFERSVVSGITFDQQVGTDPAFTRVAVPIARLNIIPNSVETIAFGKYVSADYRVPGEFIPAIGSATGEPKVQGRNEVFFNLFLPSGSVPANGWPVAIFGHFLTGHKDGTPHQVASMLAAQGLATIAINTVGHGFGPLGLLTVNRLDQPPVRLPAGGRGIDQNGDGLIDSLKGFEAAVPRRIIGQRDGRRQTVVDLMQLVRVIQIGVDVDGDERPDLDPSRIYYLGQSLGGMIGIVLLAVEPNVRAGVLNVAGAASPEWARLSFFERLRPSIGSMLASRIPPLLNAPGVVQIEGINMEAPHFHENMPLRDGHPLHVGFADGMVQQVRAPVTNDVEGAMEIQQLIEHMEWVAVSGIELAYAVHLHRSPLLGVPTKSVIIQFGRGDQHVPNPSTSALLRAGALQEQAMLFRNDLLFAENPTVPKNPHLFLTRTAPGLPERPVALGTQQQIATFFASDGTVVIHPEPAQFFEVPIMLPLPEDLNFIP